jgi:osmotically-inducible protein OsmY
MTLVRRIASLALLASALLASVIATTGCLPIFAAGIGVAALTALDRRSVKTQADDTEIELRGANRLPMAIKGAPGVSVTSFNRRVLLTGQVPSETDKTDAERVLRQVPGVTGVYNELQVAPRVEVSTAANDASLTARVKAAFIEQKVLDSSAVKVTTSSGVVYLMGLVTAREAPAYATAASRVSGVRRVVTVFEFISDEELAAIKANNNPKTPPTGPTRP